MLRNVYVEKVGDGYTCPVCLQKHIYIGNETFKEKDSFIETCGSCFSRFKVNINNNYV